jgi:hypothetical protein
MGLIVLIIPVFQEVETPLSKILWVGGIPLFLGLGLVSTFSGTVIDFEKKRIKKYQSIFWIKTGQWKPMPKVEHAELIHYTDLHRNLPNGISHTVATEITTYKCVLKMEGEKLLVFDFAKESEAIAGLEIILKALDRLKN